MKRFLLAAAIILGLAVPALSALLWIAAYCGQGSCTWLQITQVNIIQIDESVELRLVREETCHKDYPNDVTYPKSYACKPDETEVIREAVYCSKKSPRFGYQTDKNKWVVRFLSFDEDHNYHAIQWDNRLYFLECHNYDIGPEASSNVLKTAAMRFGYHPIKTPDDMEVDSVEDISPARQIECVGILKSYPVHDFHDPRLRHGHGGLVMDAETKQANGCDRWFDGENWKRAKNACQEDLLCQVVGVIGPNGWQHVIKAEGKGPLPIPGHLTKEQEELIGRGMLSIDYLPDNVEERKAMAERHPDLEGCEVFMLCDDGGDWHPKPMKGGE
jgi:hypothetical protein